MQGGNVFELLDGKGTELGVLSIILIAVITIYFAAKLDMIKLPGKNHRPKTLIKANPSSLPGNAKDCKEHAIQLAEVRIEVRAIKEDIVEIKEDLKEIKKGEG